MVKIAALFVMEDSIYKSMPGVDCYDIHRDAWSFPGGMPVVAHPPCRTWGRLKHFATAAPPHEHSLGPWSIDQVRKFGGVVEHPNGSSLFAECGVHKPTKLNLPDKHGGYLIQISQYWWGHKAEKKTLLYICGCPYSKLPPIPFRDGRPKYCVGSFKLNGSGNIRSTYGEQKPVSKKDRLHTPPAFAKWLIETARRCARPGRSHKSSTSTNRCITVSKRPLGQSPKSLRDFAMHSSLYAITKTRGAMFNKNDMIEFAKWWNGPTIENLDNHDRHKCALVHNALDYWIASVRTPESVTDAQQVVEQLNLNLADKADTVERIFCAALCAEGPEVIQSILGRYREFRSILGYKPPTSGGLNGSN